MNNQIIWDYEKSRSELSIKLARYVSDHLSEALRFKEKVGLVVSGGRTPLTFFDALSQQPLCWDRIVITLADERWVNTDELESNEKWVRAHLLKSHAASATFISLKSDAPSPHAGQAIIEARLQLLPTPIEVVVLGMGEDGHTASLFPFVPELENALTTQARCAAISPPISPGTPAQSRLTLTRVCLSSAHHLIVHITGDKKRSLLENQLNTNPEQKNQLPIRLVLASARGQKRIFWAP